VISDYLMPEMDGISFLAEIRKLKPEVPRIILTGYADKENAIKGINEVGLYQYIEKPWDNDDLRLIIRNGLEKKQLVEKLQEKINEINKAYGELQVIQQEILKAFV
jgi:DNA-binding NtrC family response regulator